MMAPAVAGGWIMVGCDAANRVKLWDVVNRMAGGGGEHYLASLPGEWDAAQHMLSVDTALLQRVVNEDIESTRTRIWATRRIDDDLSVLQAWRDRIFRVIEAAQD